MSSTQTPVDNDLKGRLALVTGASGGIGAACARKLHSHGVHLALTYSSNPTSIASLVSSLQESPVSGVRISTHQLDLTHAETSLPTLLPQITAHHGLPVTILISNAGRGVRHPQITDIPLQEFDATMAINVRAPFLLVQGVVEGMQKERWGRIVFVSSIAAYGAGVNGAHYAASKGAVVGMMKNLATRLAEWGISVNDVAPAMIGDTGMFPSPDTVPGIVDTIPIGRLGKPDEVANAVEMFCKTGYMTGQSVVIAGGLNHK
ncbi:3-oxoacyl-reductase [Saccharata proteae CBS 121410]|uniref:3-oxoacyl-reductase n=1 Tax=Saccharata proteae CBS 121410 TaxID=1314787 RepID=A0A9P4HUJ1_9PEZI|nr:3-oxoacyl-reductase [Saccharata proteae CBS 121410]